MATKERWTLKSFDQRRERLRLRIGTLALTHKTISYAAVARRVDTDPSNLGHMLSGRRNHQLDTWIEDIESAVDEMVSETESPMIPASSP